MRRSLISYLILIERCRSLQPLQNAYDALELGLFLNMFSFFNSPEDVFSYGWLSHELMKRLLYRVIHYGRDFSKTVCPRAWGKYTMRKSTSENPFITFSRLQFAGRWHLSITKLYCIFHKILLYQGWYNVLLLEDWWGQHIFLYRKIAVSSKCLDQV